MTFKYYNNTIFCRYTDWNAFYKSRRFTVQNTRWTHEAPCSRTGYQGTAVKGLHLVAIFCGKGLPLKQVLHLILCKYVWKSVYSEICLFKSMLICWKSNLGQISDTLNVICLQKCEIGKTVSFNRSVNVIQVLHTILDKLNLSQIKITTCKHFSL